MGLLVYSNTSNSLIGPNSAIFALIEPKVCSKHSFVGIFIIKVLVLIRISLNNKEDMISFRSRVKSDYFYKNVANEDDRIQEFIVFEKRYISKKEFNELNNMSHFSYRSSSPVSFNIDLIEESFTKYNISDVPINIKNQFNKTLLFK